MHHCKHTHHINNPKPQNKPQLHQYTTSRARRVALLSNSALSNRMPGNIQDHFEDLFKRRGNAARANGDREHAVLCYTQAARLSRGRSSAVCQACLANRSLAWLELGCPYRALQDAVECVQMNPSWTKVQPGTGNP
jgi:hypothetical protein